MTVDRYPLPGYAAHAWIAGNQLWLTFPPLAGNTQGHSVHFEFDLAQLRGLSKNFKGVRGLVLALEVLKARHEDSTVGERGSPTRHEMLRAGQSSKMYEAFLKEQEKTKIVTDEERKEAEAFLKSVGL